MGLLVAFFVMLVAFSTQDQQKLQIVAGSMRDAFGVQTQTRHSGIIELDGLPTRARLKNVENIRPEDASNPTTPDEKDRQRQSGARINADRAFALAAASLRQALQDMPDLAELSKSIMIEETRQGLNIEIADQDGRSMFPEGGKEPPADPEDRRPAQGDAEPYYHFRPYRREPAAAASRLWPLGTLCRSGQRGSADPRDGGHAGRSHVHDRRSSRYPSAVPGRPVYRGQSSRHDHAA